MLAARFLHHEEFRTAESAAGRLTRRLVVHQGKAFFRHLRQEHFPGTGSHLLTIQLLERSGILHGLAVFGTAAFLIAAATLALVKGPFGGAAHRFRLGKDISAMLFMALLLFRIAIGAERFPLDLDRSGSLGLLGSFGHHLLFHGSGRSRGLGKGNNRFRDRGLFISRLFGCFRGFCLHRGFRGGLDRFDFGFGCFYGSGVSSSFFFSCGGLFRGRLFGRRLASSRFFSCGRFRSTCF